MSLLNWLFGPREIIIHMDGKLILDSDDDSRDVNITKASKIISYNKLNSKSGLSDVLDNIQIPEASFGDDVKEK